MPSRTLVVAVAAAALTVLSAACSERQVFDPLPQAGPTESGPGVPSVPVFPALAKAGQVYAEPAGLYANYGSPSVSRFVLYDDGTFELQFARGSAPLTFKGRYTRDASNVKFEWDDWKTTDSWYTTGQLDGDQLTVKYSAAMSLSDFEDGTYTKVRDTQ
jgi:hypothetical protein